MPLLLINNHNHNHNQLLICTPLIYWVTCPLHHLWYLLYLVTNHTNHTLKWHPLHHLNLSQDIIPMHNHHQQCLLLWDWDCMTCPWLLLHLPHLFLPSNLLLITNKLIL